jgi:hypothetical protein
MAKTQTEPKVAQRSRAHQRYRLADGTIVPGVTTVLGVINKPQLVKWANNLGLQGIDSSKYVDETARIGTLAHEMIQEYLGGPKVDFSGVSPEQKDLAENAVLSFYEWEKRLGMKLETELIERQMVSEVHRYGGTVDWFGRIGDQWWLIDLKTSKGLYPEHVYQVSAYHRLLVEAGLFVDGVRLLRVGRTEDEGFDDHVIAAPELELAWSVFDSALKLYRAQKDYEARRKAA